MPFQSKCNLPGEFAPIRFPADFPVAAVDFAIRGEPDIPPHIHDCLEIGYCHDGEGIFLVEEKVLSFRPGDALLINNREVHILPASPGGGKTAWSFLNLNAGLLLEGYVSDRKHLLETAVFCGAGFHNILPAARYPDIAGIIRDIIETRRTEPSHYRSEIRALVWRLLLLLHRNFPPSAAEPEKASADIQRLMPALEFISRNFHKSIEVPRLAALLSTSESNFRKLFHHGMGCSPKQYLGRIRLKSAAVMLETGALPILDIASRCGFETLSNFNRQFQAHYHCSPRNWRTAKAIR